MQGQTLKADARKLMMENAPKLFIITIIVIVITTVMSELQFRLPGTSGAYSMLLEQLNAGEKPVLSMLYSNLRPAGAALAALLWLARPVVETGYVSYCLKTSRAEGGGYATILDGFLFFGKIILITLIKWVLIFLWSLLFLFPGISAYYMYSQAYYILLDDPEKGALQCVRESKRLMKGKKLDLFLIDLSFIGWGLLDYAVMLFLPLPFSFPIVSVYLTPYLGLTHAMYYDRLVKTLVV